MELEVDLLNISKKENSRFRPEFDKKDSKINIIYLDNKKKSGKIRPELDKEKRYSKNKYWIFG